MKFSHLENVGCVAVVGATGLVGAEFLSILAEHKIKLANVRLLASQSSAGETIDYADREWVVEELSHDSFAGVDVAFFSVPNEVTKKYAPYAVAAGALVVDDSSVFRMDPAVPLVVPQVNGAALRDFTGHTIATPNCTTTPLVMCLKPLADAFGLKRVVVSTYQSVSGAGKEASDELSTQTAALLNGAEAEIRVFPHRIAFNCLPLIGAITETGNSEEEEKVIRESRKILELPDLKISATAIRVPTFFGHGLSVNVELARPLENIEVVRELLDGFPGVKVLDSPSHHVYPSNVECVGSDPVFVGRIRRDHSVPAGINFWIMSDNLRKGAALNVIEIIETLYRYRKMA